MNRNTPATTSFLGIAAASAAALLLCSVHAVAEDARPADQPVVLAANAPANSPSPDSAPANSPSPDSAPPDSPAAGATADPVAPADTAAPNTDPPPPPRFDKEPFSEEKTPVPTAEEWKNAAPVTVDPDEHGPKGCTAKRVREWVQLRCAGPFIGGARMLGGKKDGLQVRFSKFTDEFIPFPEAVSLSFPVRRGDKRVMEVMEVELGYRGSQSLLPWVIISETWPEGDDSPTIALR